MLLMEDFYWFLDEVKCRWHRFIWFWIINLLMCQYHAVYSIVNWHIIYQFYSENMWHLPNWEYAWLRFVISQEGVWNPFIKHTASIARKMIISNILTSLLTTRVERIFAYINITILMITYKYLWANGIIPKAISTKMILTISLFSLYGFLNIILVHFLLFTDVIWYAS